METGGMSLSKLGGPLTPPVPGARGSSVDPRIDRLVMELHHRPEALIELLHRLQALDGFLSKASLWHVAEALGLPLSRVYGVASFYHLFRLEPPQPHRCAVCMGSACFVLGACRLAAHLEQRLGRRLEPPSGSANGAPCRAGAARASHWPAGSGAGGGSPVGPSAAAWSLEPVSCLGACGQAPVLVVDGVLALRLPLDSPGALDSRLDRLGVPRAPGLGVTSARAPHTKLTGTQVLDLNGLGPMGPGGLEPDPMGQGAR